MHAASVKRHALIEPQDGFMSLTLVAGGPGRVELSQLILYILEHSERVLLLR